MIQILKGNKYNKLSNEIDLYYDMSFEKNFWSSLCLQEKGLKFSPLMSTHATDVKVFHHMLSFLLRL